MPRYDVIVQKRGYESVPPSGAVVGIIVQVEADDEFQAAAKAWREAHPGCGHEPIDVLAPGDCQKTMIMPMEADAWEAEYPDEDDGAVIQVEAEVP